MNKNLKILLKLFFLIIAIFLFLNYFINNFDKFIIIKKLEIKHFIILSIILLCELLITGLLFKNVLKIFNINLKINEWFGLSIINNFLNYFLFKGGFVAKGHYLKQKYNFPYKNYILILIALSVIQIFSISLVAILSMLFQYCYNTFLFLFFILLFVASLLPFVLSEKSFKKISNKSKHLTLLAENWLKIRYLWKYNLSLVVLLVLITFLGSLRIYFIYKIISGPILFSSAIIITSIGYLSLFLSITPASLGVREALMSYTAELTGGNFATGIAITSLDRAIIMFWVFLLGSMFSIWYYKNNKRP